MASDQLLAQAVAPREPPGLLVGCCPGLGTTRKQERPPLSPVPEPDHSLGEEPCSAWLEAAAPLVFEAAGSRVPYAPVQQAEHCELSSVPITRGRGHRNASTAYQFSRRLGTSEAKLGSLASVSGPPLS